MVVSGGADMKTKTDCVGKIMTTLFDKYSTVHFFPNVYYKVI